ncbi:hypothetical protein JVT61DRAFT_13140 [Boletus reticuloceps]|uniref:AB hydrolase-1 domain-containing protein n=1 Tax=Boletus reticuloceps TaxID=495285 RepID=A0A8I3ADW6_9AGAM|nr:hypothetical protein JVT61DRAFT_13140 [Boletus reticuloceps]
MSTERMNCACGLRRSAGAETDEASMTARRNQDTSNTKHLVQSPIRQRNKHGELHQRAQARIAGWSYHRLCHFRKRVQHDRSPLPPRRVHDRRNVQRFSYPRDQGHPPHLPHAPRLGNTSPPPSSTSYVDCLTSDVTALLDHLYPDRGRDIQLYVAGGSFGTVPAQILYGAPYDKFPYGPCIVGVLLMGALTPLRYHKDYAKHMTWSNYFMVGPMSQWPLMNRVLVGLVTFMMARQVSTVDNADKFLRGFLFDKMDAAEREEYAQWRAKGGIAEGETERRFAENVVRSVATSWEGFKLMSSVLHADWGFQPDALDEAHSRPFVMFVTSSGDKEAPQAWTEYLAGLTRTPKSRFFVVVTSVFCTTWMKCGESF